MIITIVTYVLAVLGIIAAYELIRFIIKDVIVKRLTRSVRRYIRENNIKLDTFKFMNKFMVKHELMNDSDIHRAILDHAREKGIDIQDAETLVEEYIDEIVPFFNLLSYYKIGYWIANTLLNMLYEVVIDRENTSMIDRIPRDSAVVFVMNHRSNLDYVLVAFMLARNISISYAVGEWARVWPLEYIFKSFGAYFLRRQYREHLYHLVLEKYIQLISRQKVTQGIFIEGGLSRDGRFRSTKVGLIDYILKVKQDDSFQGDVVFVPVGINYDWVLEDRVLIKEWKEGKEKSGFKENITSLVRILVRGPFLLIFNFIRWLTGNLKQHGYASVSFGRPVPVSLFLKKHPDFFRLPRKRRLALVKEFADELMAHIGNVVPVTPVSLTAKAILDISRDEFERGELVNRTIQLIRALRKRGRRFVIGKAFKTYKSTMAHLKEERRERKRELVSFEEDFLGVNEARSINRVALDILTRRRIVSIRGSSVVLNHARKSYLEYYANMLNYIEER